MSSQACHQKKFILCDACDAIRKNREILYVLLCIEFIRWFDEFSVRTNLQFFRKIEFVYLFLCAVNVHNNIHFRRKLLVDSYLQNW